MTIDHLPIGWRPHASGRSVSLRYFVHVCQRADEQARGRVTDAQVLMVALYWQVERVQAREAAKGVRLVRP